VFTLKPKRTLLAMLLLLTFCSIPGNSYTVQPNPSFHLTILHSNDFHGYDPLLLAKQATLIRDIRVKNRNVLLINTGDTFTDGKYQHRFYGELEFAIFNQLKTDLLVLGNNEFQAADSRDKAKKHLYDRIKQAQFPVLAANARIKKSKILLPGVKPYIIKEFHGFKVGIIGLTTQESSDYTQTDGFKFKDEIKTAEKLFPEVSAKSDAVIAATHIGLKMDQKLAKAVPAFAAIIGGHSHDALQKPLMEGKTPIVQAGKYGKYLGRLDLYFSLINKKWVLEKSEGKLMQVDYLTPDPIIVQLIDTYLERPQK
jgi:2',3'-cyclic-nucleotide 2'-phosphodiesterase (5'-nucleotidase family)